MDLNEFKSLRRYGSTDGPQSFNVLLVEDCATIRAIVQLSLADDDTDIESCGTVAEAVDAVGSAAPAFDVILLDMNLPDGSGLDVLRRVAAGAVLTSIPIILFTARISDDEVAEYFSAGAIGVIVKPFDPFGLRDQIDGILRRFNECAALGYPQSADAQRRTAAINAVARSLRQAFPTPAAPLSGPRPDQSVTTAQSRSRGDIAP